jgi:multidrug efflux pump subunit AcrB
MIRRGPIAWMARNTVAANLLMIVIIVAGALGSTRVKQEVFPEFELDIVTASVAYPGASPEEVEQGIVLAIEEQVRGLDGVKRVSSTATEGLGAVTVELLLDADKEQALADVKSAVDRIRSFPEDAERPRVKLLKRPTQVISVILSGDVPLRVLHGYAERLRADAIATGTVTRVEVQGLPPREIAIEVPRETLESLGLTLDQVAMAIRAASLDLPGGEVKTKGGEVLLRVADRRRTAAEFADIVIRGTLTGAQVKLGDIAQIRDGYADTDQRTLFNDQPAVMVVAYRVGTETPHAVASGMRTTAEKLQTTLPPAVHVDFWNDQSELLEGRIDLLLRNGRLGLVLVVAILALFLNARLAFWVAMGIPISFLGSFLLMPVLGITINMISLFGLIVTLGMVVDDAIVVGEAAYSRMEDGEAPMEAAVAGAREMAVPVTFAILTTMAAFAPMFFVPGFMGKLFKILPAIIISVLLFSLLESFFILPAHLGHVPRKRGVRAWLLGGITAILDWPRIRVSSALKRFIQQRYRPFLQKVLRRRYLALSTACGMLLITIGLVGGRVVPFSFMPDMEGILVTASARLPYGTPVEKAEEVRELLEASLSEANSQFGNTAVQGRFTNVGSTPVVQGGPAPAAATVGSHLLGIQVFIGQSEDRDFSAEDFSNAWQDATPPIAGLEALTFSSAFGPNAGAAVDLRMSHTDAEVLTQASAEMLVRLQGYQDLAEIESTHATGKARLDYHLRPEARGLGLQGSEVARQLRSAFYGAEAIREQSGRDEIKVMVRLPAEQRRSQFDLEQFRVRTPSGGSVALGDVADFERNRAPTIIQREEGMRTLNVRARLATGVDSAQEVLSAVQRTDIPELLRKYPGLKIGFSGEQREQSESFAALGKNYLIALFIIFAMLAIPFRSYVQPLIIMSAIPFGIVGAIFGHLVMGYKLSMISVMGIIALSGVVVNDSLVLIDAANRYRREGAGPWEAISRAGARRFRPILLTSLTTFFGLAPMIFETSLQAKFLIPMALSLGFGVLFATFIVLLLVPAIYLIVEDIRSRLDPEQHGRVSEED